MLPFPSEVRSQYTSNICSPIVLNFSFFGRIKWNGRSVQRAGSKLSRRYERCFDEDIWLLVRSRFAPWDAIAKEMDKLEQEASS
ncbi:MULTISPECIES: hypothetical protein [Scytonema]|uniref:Uncharacterized protein n=2 Tax=Nostocales TaxID=1161 RepID=A0ABW8WPD8_9CYAN